MFTPFRHLHPALRRIILLNVGFFLLTRLEWVVGFGIGLFPLMELRIGQVWERPWTLLTYSFLHGNTFHLFINMLMLWMFGDEVAHHLGGRKFIGFYLIAALVAGFASLPFYGGSVVGASGALFGVMYLYAALYPNRTMLFFWIIPMRMKNGIWLLAFIDLMATRVGDGVAHWAHLGGFMAGILYSKLFLESGTESWWYRFRRWNWSRRAQVLKEKKSDDSDVLEPEVGIDIDQLLRKISEKGVDSLSPFERDLLRRESERRRQVRQEYNRWR